ncbi:MAG: hypothetical protein ABW039_04495 [Sphingobium sp.]
MKRWGLRGRVKRLTRRVRDLEDRAMGREDVQRLIAQSLLVPALDMPSLPADAPFLAHSTCTAADFQHPRYFQLCRYMHGRPQWHRKQWEWVFILHHLLEAGALRDGARAIGFGVGREPLPAVFAMAGVDVLATDAPDAIGMAGGWASAAQHSATLEDLRFPWIPDDLFERRVAFSTADMTAIDPALSGYDFTWSACCIEHLGSLRAGLDFVRESVETCLRPGGVAVHTTEFNLSSDESTIEEGGPTVIYRRSDLLAFAEEMRGRGHEVAPFSVGPNAHGLDFHVDLPPYLSDAHLRLRLADYSCTSAGLVIRKAA